MTALFSPKGWLTLAGGTALASIVSGGVLLLFGVHPFLGAVASFACAGAIIATWAVSCRSRSGYLVGAVAGIVTGAVGASVAVLISAVFLTAIGFTDGGRGNVVYKALALLGIATGSITGPVVGLLGTWRRKRLQECRTDASSTS